MIHTYQQSQDYNTLLDIKERIEEKYRPKGQINIINRMPRIKWVTNWEEGNHKSGKCRLYETKDI
jgi:hypothetical protein